MRRTPQTVVAFFFAFCTFAGIGGTPLPERSVSSSRQFVVHGPDGGLRGAICDLAERTKKDALGLLQQPDQWKTPIVINAQYPQANLPEAPAARLNFSQTGFGLKFQLDLSIAPDADAHAVERELLRAILLEIIYRAEPNTPAGTAYVQPPDWLLEGILALGPEVDRAALAESLGTLVASHKIMPLEDFLRQRPDLLESASQVLYRAHSAALLSMLLETPDGRANLIRFVAGLTRASNDPLADLQTHFPALRGETDKLQKAWLHSVARSSARERYRLLGCDETERELAQMLRMEVRDGTQSASVYALEEFSRFVPLPGATAALEKLTHELLLLSGRANPLHRPVIAEYQKIVSQIARGKTKKIPDRLARARETREHISRRMSAIGDYLNWFEATQARTDSGVFREYLKAAELALEREPRRRDPISVYLDSLESQF
jgi:hypothetical protein